MSAFETSPALHLNAKHTEDLRKSGLSDDTIRACDFRTESDSNRIARCLAWKSPAKVLGTCLLIPFYGADGRPLDYVRAKPDEPFLSRKARAAGQKPAKYLSPYGRESRAYFPPGTRAAVLADASIPLMITEGEKKAAKADQEGFRCIGLVGVFNFAKKRTGDPESIPQFIDDLEGVDWRDRPVYIAYDSDILDNDNVRLAEWRLARLLGRHGAVVKVLRIPSAADGSKQGLDDFLVAKGAGDLSRLLEEAKPATAPPQRRDDWDDPHRLAIAFLRSLRAEADPRRLICWNGEFCRWSDGGYRLVPVSEIDGPLREWMRREFIRVAKIHLRAYELAKSEFEAGLAKKEPKHPTTIPVTNARAANALGALRSIVRVPHDLEPPVWLEGEHPAPAGLLPMFNGIFDPAKGRLHPLDPDFFTLNVLPYEYVPNAPAPANWLKFLGQLWGDDRESIECLQEWFGYLLTADTRQQKILMLVGPKRCGKGTLLRVVQSLIGPGNVASPTLGSLAGPFGLQPLLGKSLATVGDARLSGRSDVMAVAERLLGISGEDSQTVERKHMTSVTMKLPTRFVLATNELPRLSDSSSALAGQFIVLPLTNSFYGREDHGLAERLLAELPGILHWAIGGWKRLRARGHFVQPPCGADLVTELEDLTSPIGAFVREKCLVGPGERIEVEELYRVWRRWCEDHGRREPGTEQSFGRDLRAAVPKLAVKRPQLNGERWRDYCGVRLRQISDFDRASEDVADADGPDPPPSAIFSFAHKTNS